MGSEGHNPKRLGSSGSVSNKHKHRRDNMSTPNTIDHPNFVGNSTINAVQTELFKRVNTTDDEACLYISYVPENAPGLTPSVTPYAATVTVDADGAGSSKARITLAVKNRGTSGSNNSDVSFTIDCDVSSKSDWSSGAAAAHSLKDIIDLINEDDAGGTSGKLLTGFSAWIGNAPYDLDVNVASMFVDESETYIMAPGGTRGYTSFLKRDLSVHKVDSDYIMYHRFGMPEKRDRGLFNFIDIVGTVTGTTNGTLKIYRDDYADFVEPTGTYATDLANHDVLFECALSSLSANSGSTPGVAPDADRAEVWQGPVVIEAKSDDLSAITARMKILPVV